MANSKKAPKKPQDRLKKKNIGQLVTVTLENGKEVTIPVINPDVVPAGVIRKSRHLDDEARSEAILWGTIEQFLDEDSLAELDALTMDELNEAIELANGGDELPK